MWICDGLSVISWKSKVEFASNVFVVGAKYSDDRKKPKNAVVHADQIIWRSCWLYAEDKSFSCIFVSERMVIGCRFIFLREFPSVRFMLLISM